MHILHRTYLQTGKIAKVACMSVCLFSRTRSADKLSSRYVCIFVAVATVDRLTTRFSLAHAKRTLGYVRYIMRRGKMFLRKLVEYGKNQRHEVTLNGHRY